MRNTDNRRNRVINGIGVLRQHYLSTFYTILLHNKLLELYQKCATQRMGSLEHINNAKLQDYKDMNKAYSIQEDIYSKKCKIAGHMDIPLNNIL